MNPVYEQKKQHVAQIPSPEKETEWMESTYMKLQLGRWDAQEEEERQEEEEVWLERGKQTQG